MKKLIPFFLLFSLHAMAFCDNTDKIFLSESDDVGTTLDLAYTCTGDRSEVCIFIKDKLVSINGDDGVIALSSAELYKRKISDKENTLEVTIQTGFFDSIFEKQYINVKLDKTTMTGQLKYGGRGLSPYEGTTSPYRTKEISCVKEESEHQDN